VAAQARFRQGLDELSGSCRECPDPKVLPAALLLRLITIDQFSIIGKIQDAHRAFQGCHFRFPSRFVSAKFLDCLILKKPGREQRVYQNWRCA
jgi:hypothetical protein